MIVQIDNADDHQLATEQLKFATNYVVEAPKKFLPRLTIHNVPSKIMSATLIGSLCQKDKAFNQILVSGKMFEVIKCWKWKIILEL